MPFRLLSAPLSYDFYTKCCFARAEMTQWQKETGIGRTSMRLEETGEATSGDHQDSMPASPLAKMQYSVSETHSYAAADMKSWCCIAYVHPYHPLQKPPERPSPRSSCKWEV